MNAFLEATAYIDADHPSVLATARELAAGRDGDEAVAGACFEFVRDTVRHSADYRLNPVTCRASDVLEQRTGYCYAKSHLLAALLRANGIPAGLCYQRLSIDDRGPPFSLHGLNAVYLTAHGWYRIDPRGNKAGVTARFAPPVEHLAYPLRLPGEADLPGIHAEPLACVVDALVRNATWDAVAADLPDVTPGSDAWREVVAAAVRP